MDDLGFILLGVLVILAFPVIAIIALVNALSAKETARRLAARVEVLEQARLAAPSTAALVQPAAAPSEAPPVIVAPPVVAHNPASSQRPAA